MLEQRELLRMQVRDLGYELACAVRWHALAARLDCPLCHLLGVAKFGPCPLCLPTAAAFAELENA